MHWYASVASTWLLSAIRRSNELETTKKGWWLKHMHRISTQVFVNASHSWHFASNSYYVNLKKPYKIEELVALLCWSWKKIISDFSYIMTISLVQVVRCFCRQQILPAYMKTRQQKMTTSKQQRAAFFVLKWSMNGMYWARQITSHFCCYRRITSRAFFFGGLFSTTYTHYVICFDIWFCRLQGDEIVREQIRPELTTKRLTLLCPCSHNEANKSEAWKLWFSGYTGCSVMYIQGSPIRFHSQKWK